MVDALAWAVRRIARHKAFSAVLIANLAVGIGVCLTVLAAIDSLLFRPPVGVAEPDRLKRVYVLHSRKPGAPFDLGAVTSPATYTDLREAVGSVADLAAYSAYEASARIDGSYRQVGVTFVSDNYFAVMRIRPQIGRLLAGPAADGAGGTSDAVIAHHLWRQAFSSRPDVIGRTLILNSRTLRVVGVAPRGFRGVEERQVDVWLDMASAAAITDRQNWMVDRSSGVVLMIARMRPGARAEALLASARTGLAQLSAAFPSPFWTERAEVADVTAPESAPVDQQRTRISGASSAVGVAVLLLICFNAANLLLTSGAGRAREFVVRSAVGASRSSLTRLVAGEVVILVAIAGVLGTLCAMWASALLRGLIEGVPPLVVDARLAFEALAVTGTAGVIAAVLPALSASRADLTSLLKEGSSARQPRASRLLVVLGVAGAVMILICAALLGASFIRAGRVDLGFDPRRLLVASVKLAPAAARGVGTRVTPERAYAFYDEALARIRALPGVESASVSGDGPFLGMTASEVGFPERGENAEARAIVANDRVSIDYFRTMGIRLLQGRAFGPEDFRGVAQSAVVNDAMARVYWPHVNPVGRCLAIESGPAHRCLVVVGVVASARTTSIRDAPTPMFYVPIGPGSYQSAMTLFVRTRGERAEATRELRDALQAVGGDVSQLNVRRMRTVVEPQMRPWRSAAALFAVGAAVALLVAALGVYSALSYSVARRTSELGVRMAMGATSSVVMRQVVLDGLRTSCAGIVAGCLAGAAAASLLRPLLYDVHYLDPAIYFAASLGVVGVAVAASYLPAQRAASVDPIVALRAE